MTEPCSQHAQRGAPGCHATRQRFLFCLFPHALAHPSLRWDWKRKFWNTQGRPFLWYFHPSQKQEALENQPKRKRNKVKIRLLGSLPAWFPSQRDLEKHLNVSEVIQIRLEDFPSLLGVWANCSLLSCAITGEVPVFGSSQLCPPNPKNIFPHS